MDSSASATGTLNSSICSRASKIQPIRRRFSSGVAPRDEALDVAADLLVDQPPGAPEASAIASR